MIHKTCDRRCFLQIVSVATATAWAGCGAGTAGTVTPANGTAEVPFAQFSDLMSSGGGAIIDVSGVGPVAVVRTGSGTAVALSAVCTHAGCTVGYDSGAMDLHCPCHGSTFDLGGHVLRGPASQDLPAYPATVGATGITIKLS